MIPAVLPTYARSELAFERGEGAYLITADGERYLDFAAGIAVNSLGHSHPHLVETLIEQGKKLWHTSNLYEIPEQTRLAERLVANTFADSVFFGNSGAEAGELAIKIVRKYHDDTGHPERYRIIGCQGAFHGRTLATLAAAGNEKYLKGYAPNVDGFDSVAFGNLNELRAAITPETAAIMVEPVQGEGGVRPGSIDYLKGLRAVADEFGLLLVFDEVQCGMGRTGKLFAHEWAGVTPDVMMVAKGLGGGFPVGAVLATENAVQGFAPGAHGSTFGGNPLAMAVSNAVLDVMLAPGFMATVDKNARILWNKLQALADRYPQVIAEVRGAGLLLGIKCVVPNGEMVDKLRAQKLLTVGAADNVVRLVPPLTIGTAEIDQAVAAIDAACRTWSA
ncbi:MAG TPA: aspartate aminotransferase family protein [Aliidongia sp.]|uniref:aspartate aminotransferase family protein n=1 Tax=Aliidongia sp. TaxID=1914230 RepID=UPI002DDDA3F7|nr:aspartate aminotransferase family protein [Aliidongia sp.]HEV2677574.1 aspartate aminotransferase family protein [Aliidongia sp.]